MPQIHPQKHTYFQPNDESGRLKALYRTKLLDTPRESAFDAITLAASTICDTPYSFVCLVDAERVWFKSAHGIEGVDEIPSNIGFCPHTVKQDSILEIPNALHDNRFCDSPLVADAPQFRYYAGIPLITDDGYALGTLCVMDTQPRLMSETNKANLYMLADAVTDLLEAKRIKESKRLAVEHRLDDIVENSLNEVYLIDQKTEKFVYANRAALNNTGYTLNKLKKLDWRDIVINPQEQLIEKNQSSSYPSGTQKRFETVHKRADNSTYHTDNILQLFGCSDNEQLLICNDITEQKNAKQREETLINNIMRMSRINTLNALASGLAHELTQPLTALNQYFDNISNYIERNHSKNESIINTLSLTKLEMQRATEIIKRFRIFANGKKELEKNIIDVNELTKETKRLLAQNLQKNNITFTINIQDSLPTFHADHIQIQQVLLNLIVNSIQAMENQISNKEIHLRCTSNTNKEIVFSVSDSGPGIKQKSIFDIAGITKSIKPGGSGLGLSICKHIIESHRGSIWHDELYQGGAQFNFSLPSKLSNQ